MGLLWVRSYITCKSLVLSPFFSRLVVRLIPVSTSGTVRVALFISSTLSVVRTIRISSCYQTKVPRQLLISVMQIGKS